MTDQFEAFTEGAEQLSAAAVEVPQMLQDAVAKVATFARDLSDTVAAIDALRDTLNAQAHQSGLPRFPDFLHATVAARDPSLGPFLAALRRGPAATASALGKAARRPARDPLPEPVPEFTDAAVDEAGTAAVGLLSALYHNVHDLGAAELIGGADPHAVSAVLAALVLSLAEELVPDVGAWLVTMAAENATAGG